MRMHLLATPLLVLALGCAGGDEDPMDSDVDTDTTDTGSGSDDGGSEDDEDTDGSGGSGDDTGSDDDTDGTDTDSPLAGPSCYGPQLCGPVNFQVNFCSDFGCSQGSCLKDSILGGIRCWEFSQSDCPGDECYWDAGNGYCAQSNSAACLGNTTQGACEADAAGCLWEVNECSGTPNQAATFCEATFTSEDPCTRAGCRWGTPP